MRLECLKHCRARGLHLSQKALQSRLRRTGRCEALLRRTVQLRIVRELTLRGHLRLDKNY